MTTVENNKMDKSNPVGSGSFSINRKTGSAIGTNSFVAGGTDNIASSPNQHVQGRYNVEDSSSVYADIIGNGTADDNRKNIEATDWNGNKHLKGDVYVGCNDDSSGGTKLVKNGDSITDLEEDSTHRTVTDTENARPHTIDGMDIDTDMNVSPYWFKLTLLPTTIQVERISTSLPNIFRPVNSTLVGGVLLKDYKLLKTDVLYR